MHRRPEIFAGAPPAVGYPQVMLSETAPPAGLPPPQPYPQPQRADIYANPAAPGWPPGGPKPHDGGPQAVYILADGTPSRNQSSDVAGQADRNPAAGGGCGPSAPPAPGSSHHSLLQAASWLVPDPAYRYTAIFSSVVILGMCFVFAFMAGDYDTWLRSPGGITDVGGPPPPPPNAAAWGPSKLASWLRFWQMTSNNTFNPGYLYAWGARYGPSVAAGQWWRLFASFCLHSSFAHLLSNMVLFAMLAAPLEHNYGPLRILLIFLASAFGGNFLSMAFEDPCIIYVGASGAVFGFIGLAIADLLLNWDSIKAPIVRLVIMLATLGLTIAVEYIELPYMRLGSGKVSHLSHVGGLLGGLFVSFAFLPNLKDRRFKALRRFAKLQFNQRLPRAAPGEHASCWRRNRVLHFLCLGLCAAVVLFLFVALPAWIWTVRLPQLQCPAVPGFV